MQEQAIAGGAERVLYVLATLAREEAPLTVAALAERTGLAQSTLYRQVALLKRWGFVLEQAGAYTPGPLCVQLARGFDQSSYLIQEALPDMTRLAADSGETVGLLVAMSDQAVCLEMVESRHPLRCSFVKGRGLPLARGGLGQVADGVHGAGAPAGAAARTGRAGRRRRRAGARPGGDPRRRLRGQRQRGRRRRVGLQRAGVRAAAPGRRLDHPDGAFDARGRPHHDLDQPDAGGRQTHFQPPAAFLTYPCGRIHPYGFLHSNAVSITKGSIMTTRRQLLTAALTLSLAWGAGAAHAQETIRAVTDATFPPMEFVKDGKRTGFDIELVEALAQAMGKKVEWIDIDFKGLIPALQAGRADIAVSAIYITAERQKVVDFTDPYYAGGLVVLTKKDGPIKSLKDLEGRKVSVQVGTKSVNYLKEHFPKVQRVEVEKNQEMFNLVQIGRADAAVTGKPAAKLFAQSTQDLTVLAEQITTEEYGIAVPKSKSGLTRELNEALKKLKADGTYERIVNKWFEAQAK